MTQSFPSAEPQWISARLRWRPACTGRTVRCWPRPARRIRRRAGAPTSSPASRPHCTAAAMRWPPPCAPVCGHWCWKWPLQRISPLKQWTRWSSQGTPRCCTCSRRQTRTVFPMPRSPLPACLEKRLRLGSLACPASMRMYICPAVCPLLWVRTSPRRCWPAASAPSRTPACWWILEPTARSLFGIAGSFPAAPRPPGPPLRGPGFPWGWPERRAQWITSAYRTAHCRPTSLGAARRKGSAAAASSTRLPACWSWSSWTRPGFWSRTLRPLRRLYA